MRQWQPVKKSTFDNSVFRLKKNPVAIELATGFFSINISFQLVIQKTEHPALHIFSSPFH